ncbi:MAG TPA: thioredoxin domain-containing protein [Jiangellaceae bacterium]|nr:thioredoxin domain-containing protein [Jiangellaceae bacterium]
MPNRLQHSLSPYLKQHQDNPVEWWPWSDEAFAEAARRRVPVLLSIGYAACHWCHVMAHESFEDDDIAAYLNEHFVAVKVDREERPDVDSVYMDVLQAMTGQGGWPMTVFLTPDGRPFYAGTYFPSTPRGGMPSFGQLLQAIHQAWQERHEQVVESASSIVGHLDSTGGLARTGVPDQAALDTAVQQLAGTLDETHGGFGGAPKFPPSMVLEFLLRHYARTGDPEALRMVELTGERMARGGIYDQLAGGFARYSVDSAWVVPHFEKMLYDNALLLRAYLSWWRTTGSQLGERIVRETAEFLLRDLRTVEGGFASALDADAPVADGNGSAEGASYVWTPDQLASVLGADDAQAAAALLRVTPEGTFEHGASTLQLPVDPGDAEQWRQWRAALLAARNERPQPMRDDKVVTAWNGLAIAALAEAGAALDEPAWLEAASRCGSLLIQVHGAGTADLRRVSRDGVGGTHPAVLEDHAGAAEGFLALLSATGDPQWLDAARGCAQNIIDRFAAPDGGFYDTAHDAEDERLARVRRPRDPVDNATPSGTSLAAGVLLTLTALTGTSHWREAAEDALTVYRALAHQAPRFAGWALAVSEAAHVGPLEVVIVGEPGRSDTQRLLARARQRMTSGAVVVPAGAAPNDTTTIPLVQGRAMIDGNATAYVCRGFTCRQPTDDPDELDRQLQGAA